MSTNKNGKNNEPNLSALGVKSLNLSDLKAVNTNSHEKELQKENKDEYQILNSSNKVLGAKGDYDNMFDPKIMST